MAVITINVTLGTTTQQRELQVQIVKGLVQQERSVLLEQPPALIVLQGSLVPQLEPRVRLHV